LGQGRVREVVALAVVLIILPAPRKPSPRAPGGRAVEQRRHHDHVQRKRGEQAAEHHDRERVLDLVAGLAGREREGQEREPGRERRHHDRVQALDG